VGCGRGALDVLLSLKLFLSNSRTKVRKRRASTTSSERGGAAGYAMDAQSECGRFLENCDVEFKELTTLFSFENELPRRVVGIVSSFSFFYFEISNGVFVSL
jgi:hypothetical protein